MATLSAPNKISLKLIQNGLKSRAVYVQKFFTLFTKFVSMTHCVDVLAVGKTKYLQKKHQNFNKTKTYDNTANKMDQQARVSNCTTDIMIRTDELRRVCISFHDARLDTVENFYRLTHVMKHSKGLAKSCIRSVLGHLP